MFCPLPGYDVGIPYTMPCACPRPGGDAEPPPRQATTHPGNDEAPGPIHLT